MNKLHSNFVISLILIAMHLRRFVGSKINVLCLLLMLGLTKFIIYVVNNYAEIKQILDLIAVSYSKYFNKTKIESIAGNIIFLITAELLLHSMGVSSKFIDIYDVIIIVILTHNLHISETISANKRLNNN
jgi:hypothetical protein